MTKVLSRQDIRKRLQGIVNRDWTNDMSPKEKKSIQNLLATANEVRQKHSSGSYIDEKMSKSIMAICDVTDDKPSMCRAGAKEWAEEAWR